MFIMACRLCLKITLNASSAQRLESLMIHYGLVRVLLPQMDMDLCGDPFICRDCIESLRFWKTFKQQCLNSESKIELYNGYEKKKIIDLVEVIQYYRDINPSDYEEGFICRLCLIHINDGKCYRLDDVSKCALMKICLSKFDAETVLNPLMCEKCAKSIERIYNFLQKSLNVQETLKTAIRRNRLRMLENKDIQLIAKCQIDTKEYSLHLKPETFVSKVDSSTLGGTNPKRKQEQTSYKEAKMFKKAHPGATFKMDDDSSNDGVEIHVLSSDDDTEFLDENCIKIEIEDHDLNEEECNTIEHESDELADEIIDLNHEDDEFVDDFDCEVPEANPILNQNKANSVKDLLLGRGITIKSVATKNNNRSNEHNYVLKVQANSKDSHKYSCKLCSFKTKYRNSFHRHVKLLHSGKEMYPPEITILQNKPITVQNRSISKKRQIKCEQ